MRTNVVAVDRKLKKAALPKHWLTVVGVLLGLGLLVGLGIGLFGRGKDRSENVTYTVTRGDMRVTVVTKSGDLRAKESVDTKCELEGNSTISWLIPEGTLVKKGDLLVELDPSGAGGMTLEERHTQQQITLESARAEYLQADEGLEIQKSRNESDIRAAELKVKFAEMDLEKYTGEDGQWEQDKAQALSEVTMAKWELELAKDRHKWTTRLYEKEYVTESDLEADKLAKERAEIMLANKEAALKLLERYDHPKKLEQLRSDYTEAQAELERVERQARSQEAQAQSNKNATGAALKLQQERLDKLADQMKKTKIYAPQDGVAVYAAGRRRWDPPLKAGSTVNLRQLLVSLPDISTLVVDARVDEVDMDKVRPGQEAYITFDARPGLRLRGEVTKVSSLPDADRRWASQMKEYALEISLDDEHEEELQLGLSVQAEIIIASLSNVFFVPLQAVSTRDGERVCYVEVRGRFEPREVILGMSNNEVVEIKSGLREGDRVLLYAPQIRGEGTGLKADVEAEKSRPSERSDKPDESKAETAENTSKSTEPQSSSSEKKSPDIRTDSD